MKKIIFLLLIINLNLLISQDLINPPRLQRLDTTTAIDRSNHFVKGWNWGTPGKRLDSAMLMNTYHDFPESSTDTKYNVRTMEVPGVWGSFITGGRNGNYVFLGQTLHLEPSIKVDSTDNFRARFGDNNGSVFGFYNRNFTVGDTVSSGIDFDRFKLYPAGITSPVRVLDNAWNANILRYLDYEATNHNDIDSPDDIEVYYPFNGKQYYLSANLRALNITSLESHLNDTLLSLKVKYWVYDTTSKSTTTSYVKFDQIPQNNSDSLIQIKSTINNHFRGFARKLVNSPTQPSTIYITGRMLKISGIGQDTNNITISAFANFDGIRDQFTGLLNNNPHFKGDWHEDLYNLPAYITKVDIEVDYYGKDSIAIDWIRLETPRAQKILRGGSDSVLNVAVN